MNNDKNSNKYQINTDMLHIGQVFKNYKIMCKELGQIYIVGSSSSRHSQIKEWKRYIDWKVEGHKITITEIYNPPLPKVDGRKNNGFKDFPDKNIFQLTREQYNNIGVYAIILNKDIYIGSTTNSFLHRYRQHCNPKNKLPTFDMLKNGAIFKPLWIADESCNESVIRQKESEYINKYFNDENWNIMNSRMGTHCNSYKGEIFYNGVKVKPIDKNIKLRNKKSRNLDDIRYIKIKHKYYDEAIKLLKDRGML